MSEIKNLAINLLSNTQKYPQMYASTKEAYITRVATILEMSDENFSAQNFYEAHLKTLGSNYLDLNEEVNELWAQEVVNDALNKLNGL